MIAACPECRTQYRVDPQRLSAEGVRLRCCRCETIFRVRPPQAAPRAAALPQAAPERSPTAEAPAAPSVPSVPQAPGPASPPAEGLTPLSERLVLVATPDAELAKAWAGALRGWGLEALTAHDGVETMLQVQRRMPRAVVLDAQLSKMFGFQVCEFMKRNDSLRRIGVVLIGAIHHAKRYHRGPSELYGADAYVEAPDLPDALVPLLRDLGLPIGPGRLPPPPEPARTSAVDAPPGADAPPEPAPPPVPPPIPAAPEPPHEAPAPVPPPVSFEPAPAPTESGSQPPPVAPEPEGLSVLEPDPDPEPPAVPAPAAESRPAPTPTPAAGEGDADVARAERLARIIVSDVILYNQEKFEAAVAAGNVLEALQSDLADGRAHFAQRIPEAVRAQRDFLADELLRVARSRGAAR